MNETSTILAESTSQDDTYATLYDSYMNIITYNDDSGYGPDFLLIETIIMEEELG